MQNIAEKVIALEKFKIKKHHASSEEKHHQMKKLPYKRHSFAGALPINKRSLGLVKSLKQTIHQIPHSKLREIDSQNLIAKENKILQKLILTKNQKSRGKRWYTQMDEELYIKKASFSDMQSLQIKILKPTQRYFHYLNNVKLAQKILLATPSESVNRQSQRYFYNKQNKYKINLRRMNYQDYKQIVHKRSWID